MYNIWYVRSLEPDKNHVCLFGVEEPLETPRFHVSRIGIALRLQPHDPGCACHPGCRGHEGAGQEPKSLRRTVGAEIR